MNKYTVRYNPKAVVDIQDSFEWGVRNWGESEARDWLRKLHIATRNRLETMPLSCQFALESKDSELDIRQFIYGRYRILFTIDEDVVLILYVRGPFNR